MQTCYTAKKKKMPVTFVYLNYYKKRDHSRLYLFYSETPMSASADSWLCMFSTLKIAFQLLPCFSTTAKEAVYMSGQVLLLHRWHFQCVHAKSLQSCLLFCNPMNCSLPGSSVHGILQAGTLEWVAMPSSKGSSPPRDWTLISYVSCIGRWVLYC